MNKIHFVVVGLLVVVLAFVYYPQHHVTKASPRPLPPAEVWLKPYDDPNPYSRKLVQAYETYIRRALQSGLAPGAAVVIVKDTSIIFLKGFGRKESHLEDSVNINTVFRIGSVSKCLTAVLVGTLVRDHILSWDDPVVKYLPDFKLKSSESTQALTIKHLLSHTTGLPYHAFTNMVEEGIPLDTLIKSLRTLELTGQPGQIYSYQNVGFSVIEKVIEAATRLPFEEVLHQRLFNPLKMEHASASYGAILHNKNVAKPNFRIAKGWITSSISDTYYNVAPAGGINASISDMGLWLTALMGKSPEVLPEQTLSEIFQPQVRAVSKNRSFGLWKWPRASYYALGWRVVTFKDDTLNYHGGYVNGYRSEVAIDPKNRMAICVLTNAPGGLADQSIPRFFALYSSYRDSIQVWDQQKSALP